ncbi:MAG: hypothetical protein ABSG10_00545 [Terracidiphilus sp.]|jgi:hypothetical protein
MAIFIDKVQVTDNGAIGFISEPDNLARKIVRTWHKSNIAHCFDNKSRFIKAVHRNREILRSKARREIRLFFTSSNYLFSTEAEGREETLYFKDRATKRTGRLRQQHSKGPLAKIDKEPRKHLFLSKDRFCTEKRRYGCKGGRPCFRASEIHKKSGKHHLEYWRDGRGVFHCHFSGGTVRTGGRVRTNKRRIDRALKEILGIDHK